MDKRCKECGAQVDAHVDPRDLTDHRILKHQFQPYPLHEDESQRFCIVCDLPADSRQHTEGKANDH